MDYPPDSTISYNWTEHLDDDLNRTIADTILTINYTHSYHLEAQMYDDEEITIPVYNLLEHTPEELSQRKMIILIPFMLFKLKDSIKKERTPENMEALRTLILDDIINLIQNNQDAGNITISDANRLRSLIRKLYNHLYSHYNEFIEGGFNDMMEDGLVLDVDIIEAELTKKVTKRVTKEVTEQVTQQNQKDTICKLYSKLNDTAQVADLLDIPVDTVKEAIRQ